MSDKSPKGCFLDKNRTCDITCQAYKVGYNEPCAIVRAAMKLAQGKEEHMTYPMPTPAPQVGR